MKRNLFVVCAALALLFVVPVSYAQTVGPGDIQRNAVRGKHVKRGAIKSSEVRNNSLKAKDLAAESVGTSELQTEAVTNTKIAPGAVSTKEIEDGAVTFEKLAPSVLLSFLSAYVDKDGNLQAGTPGTTAKRQGTGLYFVTFPVPVNQCFSLGQVSYLDALPGAQDTSKKLLRTFTDQVGFGPNVVRVATQQVKAASVDDADASFSLMVFCL